MIFWDRIAELRTELGEDDFAEIVTLFLEEVDEVIDRLRRHPDPERYAEDLHFLKGSALNLGFGAFGAECRNREAMLSQGKPAAVDLAPVIRIYEESRTALLERFPQAAA